MSLAESAGLTLLRSALIVLVALPLLRPLLSRIELTSWPVRRLLWVMLLAPMFYPGLVTGYAYANSSLSLIHYPKLQELAYGLLVLTRVVPVGVVVLFIAPPPPMSAEALHCRQLARRATFGLVGHGLSWLACWIRGPSRHLIVSGALIFLLAFQDFELASLLGVTSWTVWLFDAQAGGLILAESLRFATIPLAIQAGVLLPLLVALYRSQLKTHVRPAPRRLPRWAHVLTTAYIAIALLVCCVLPSMHVLRGTVAGMGVLVENFTLTRDIVCAMSLSLLAGTLAYQIGALLLVGESSRLSKACWLTALLASLPGLLGALTLSLVISFVFQRSWLSGMYDSAVPWLVGLTLYLLPRALAFHLVLNATRPAESLHALSLLRQSAHIAHLSYASDLIWVMLWRARLGVWVLIVYWGYLDVTTAAILSPTTMVSAPVRMYNLMHYGQSLVLSAMVCATVLIPVLCVMVLMPLRRPVMKWIS